MASTTFYDGTVVEAEWLNEVNQHVFSIDNYSGVDPTGVDDSAAAITAAIAAASLAGVKTLRFPGIYKILSAVTLANDMTYEITGTINATLSTGAVLQMPSLAENITVLGFGVGVIAGAFERGISSVVFSTATNIRVEGMDISGATVVGTGYTAGIFLDGCTRVWIKDNYLHGNGTGDFNATVNADVMFYVGAPGNTDCHVEGNIARSTLVSIHYACFNFTESSITNNFCKGAQCGSDQNKGYGILTYATGASPQVDRVRISGNTVVQTGGSGIYVVSGTQVVVSDNVCVNTAQTQLDVSLAAAGISMNTPVDAVVTGNLIFGSGKNGISWVAAGGGVVSNNRIYGATQYGLHIRGACNLSTFTGNTFYHNGIHIYQDTATYGLVLSNNTFSESNVGEGVRLDNVTDSTINANVFQYSYVTGLFVAAGARNTISNNIALDNGYSSNNTYNGITNQSTSTIITGNRCSNNAGVSQKYGILSSGNHCTVSNNLCLGNITDGLSLTGTDIDVMGNRYSTGPTSGTATLVAGTVTVSNVEVRNGDFISLSRVTAGGTQGTVGISAISNATSFTILSDSATDTSTYRYKILH